MIDVPLCATEGEPDDWFSTNLAAQARACAVCARCSLAEACATNGLTEPDGIWGGVNMTTIRLNEERRVTPLDPGWHSPVVPRNTFGRPAKAHQRAQVCQALAEIRAGGCAAYARKHGMAPRTVRRWFAQHNQKVV